MQRSSAALALPLVLASTAVGQRLVPVDSMMTVRGIVELRTDQTDSTGTWVVFLPSPIALRDLRTNIITLAGGARQAGRFADRYVELAAHVAVERDRAGRTTAIADDARIQEVQPDGLVRRDVALSITEQATVELAVVPGRVAWRDSAGAPNGVTPSILFSIVNHSQTEMRFFFPTNEIVCVRVRPTNAAGGHDLTWSAAGPERRVIVRMGSRFRQILAIPAGMVAAPGRYVVRVALCGADTFHAETTFDVY